MYEVMQGEQRLEGSALWALSNCASSHTPACATSEETEMKPGLRKETGAPRTMASDTRTWLDHLISKDPGVMTPLPCVYLKCTSMIMNTMNFSIDYSAPFVPASLTDSYKAFMTQQLLSPSHRLLSKTGYQVSQSGYVLNTRNPEMLKEQSEVKVTLQYLGAGFRLSSEVISLKDELSMFQQICAGHSICVFKGYLSPGDTFQITSRRQCGHPFTASIYINGLIAVRISWCCEYRYRPGLQPGRRGCFRIVQLSGGQPCDRCLERHSQNKHQTTPGGGRTCDASVASHEKALQKMTEAMQVTTWSTHSVCVAPPSTQPPARRRRRRVKKKTTQQEVSDSEQENKMHHRYQRPRRPRLRDSRKGCGAPPLTQDQDDGGKPPVADEWKAVVETSVSSEAAPEHEGQAESSPSGSASPAQTQCPDSANLCAEECDTAESIQRKLATALREGTWQSDVELSDSSDSSDTPGSAESNSGAATCPSDVRPRSPLPVAEQQVAADSQKQGEEKMKVAGEDEEVAGEDKEVKGEDEEVAGEGKEVAGEDEEVEGEDEEVAGEGKEVAGEGKEVAGEDEEVAGEDKEVEGEDEEVAGEGKEVAGEDEEVAGEGKEVAGEDEEVEGEGKEVEGEDEEVAGEGKEVAGEDEEVEGEGKEVEGEDDEVEGEGKEVEGEDEEVAGEGKEVAGEGKEVAGEDEAVEGEDDLLCQITDLTAVLRECDEVEQLVLRNTGMTDFLLQHLAPAIACSRSQLESINLNLNDIGPGGAETLVHLVRGKPSIKSLLLHGNQLGDEGVKTLMRGFSELLRKDSDSPQDVSGFQLSELDIGGNQLGRDGLRSVAAFLRLNPPLTHLGLAHSCGEACDAWQELFEAVKMNTNLTHLLLDENHLGDVGARLIADVIRANSKLVSIDLDSNDIGEEGGRAIAESLASGTGSALTDISLDDNPISTETREVIVKLLAGK